MVLPPGSNITFNRTLETATAAKEAVQITTKIDQVPGTVMTGATTSATEILAPLKPPIILVVTTFSPYLTPDTILSENPRTTILPTPGSLGLELPTVPVIATPAPQGQPKLTRLVGPPANATVPPGASSLPNEPLPAEPAQ